MTETYLRTARLIQAAAYDAAKAFKLTLNGFAFNELLADDNVWGICFTDDKVISMRILGSTTNRQLPTWRLLETLAHELAHLDIPGHNRAHKKLTASIFEYLKRQFKVSK